MTSIAPEMAQTLAALITATVFSAGFLSTRVHRERGRAIDRVRSLDESVASAIREKKALDADWFDAQVEALDWSLRDGLDRLVLGLNIALGLGVIGLAAGAGLAANVAWRGSQGILLLAYAVTALAVITIGTLDVVLARRGVKGHYRATAVGQMHEADSLLVRANRHPTSEKLEQARKAGELAVRYSYGLYGPAWASLGYADLLSLTKPRVLRPHLLFAQRALERAVKLGPETAPMRSALAFVYELRGDYERAAANWIRAWWTYHEATRPLAYSDKTATSPRARKRASGRSREGLHLSAGPYVWRFVPRMPLTLSLALDQLPPYKGAALYTAKAAVEASSSHPQSNERVIQSLERWLEKRILLDGSWLVADGHAAGLLKLNGSPDVLAAIAKFRSGEGPIGQARRAQQADLAAMAGKSTELGQHMERLLQDMNEAQARRERLNAGQGTAEDIEWIDEALSAATPEAMANWLAESERWQKEMEEQLAVQYGERKAHERMTAELKTQQKRFERLWNGLATEDDLAPYADSEGSPWPEPDLVQLMRLMSRRAVQSKPPQAGSPGPDGREMSGF